MRQRDAAYIARTVEKMVRSAKAQAQLIEDLLDISRIVSGKIRIEPAPVDLAEVVRAALDTVRPAADAKELTIELDLAPDAGIIIGDANRLQQIVWNLLSNAVKFTPSGGAIIIELKRRVALVQLSVRDTGQGIPTDFLPFVFDRFRQADGTTHRAHGGLGLGLASCATLSSCTAAVSAGQAPVRAWAQRSPCCCRLPIVTCRYCTTRSH
ncbi:HAMP domain-containing histidine kinase [Candidatus Gracilibacteria bacterium]|nr:HAMP domain-containing histidine kinase [Candidatus Gracilibacteria bacterium]